MAIGTCALAGFGHLYILNPPDLIRPSPLGLKPAAAGDTAPDTGALRGVPSRASASSSAMSSSIATPTAAAPAEVPEYIDA